MVTEDSYGQLVDSQNVNRAANGVEARNVTEALAALGVQEEEDKHPERYTASDQFCLAQNLKLYSQSILQPAVFCIQYSNSQPGPGDRHRIIEHCLCIKIMQCLLS